MQHVRSTRVMRSTTFSSVLEYTGLPVDPSLPLKFVVSAISTTYPGVWTMRQPLPSIFGVIEPTTPSVRQRS